MTLTYTQRCKLNHVFKAMNPDGVLGGQQATNKERIRMYFQSAHDDPRRAALENCFLFLWSQRDTRMTNYKLCPGDAADLLGHFYRD